MASADDDDYNKFNFCFKDFSEPKEEPDYDLNKFYEGFIETNYLFIHKLLRNDEDTSNNVCKAKFFIITLAFLYYFKNKDKIQILKNKYDLNNSIDNIADIRGLYEKIKPKVIEEATDVNVETDSGTSVTSPQVPLPAPAPPSPLLVVTSVEQGSPVPPALAPLPKPLTPLPAVTPAIGQDAPLPKLLKPPTPPVSEQQQASAQLVVISAPATSLPPVPPAPSAAPPPSPPAPAAGFGGDAGDTTSNPENLEEEITEPEPKKSINDYKDIFIINNLLIFIMKNIMIATKANLTKIKTIYKGLK